MNLDEIFSNKPIDESLKGEAIKQGARRAAKYTKVMGKKAFKNSKKFLNKPVTKTRKGLLASTGAAFTAGRLSKRGKNESINDEIFSNTPIDEMNISAASNALKGAGKSVFKGTKEVVNNFGNTAKTVGGAIKKHPVRTAALAGTAGAGYLGYKGAKKASSKIKGAAKNIYNDWKV